MKCCKNCGTALPAGLRSDAEYCSPRCGGRYRNRSYYKRHPDDLRSKRKRDNADTRRRMIYRVKSRAKREGIPFNLVLDDIQIPRLCPILGIRLKPNHGRQGYFPDSPSLDRIDPNGGYIKENVRVISARANLLKNDATVAELESVLGDLKRLRGSK